LPKGTRDFKFNEEILRQRIIATIKKIFELHGFLPLETPILERFEILKAKYAGGAEILKEVFKLRDQGGRILGLRYDLTVPLARFIAINPTVKLPFKRYQFGPVFRDGPIRTGRYRQFYQFDGDIIGVKNILAEVELINIVKEVFKTLGIDVVVKVNNRKLLSSILKYSGVKEKYIEKTILAVDKLEKIGKKGVEKELKAIGLENRVIKKLFWFLNKKGKDLIRILKDLMPENEGLKEIDSLFKYIKEKDVIFDASLARGLVYYTGTIFEVFDKEGRIKSSLAAGGRYDEMIGKFVQKNMEFPAVGVSFGIDVIFDLLRKNLPKLSIDVLVIPIKEYKEALEIAKKLRKNGINTDFALSERSLSKNLEYANSLGIPYVIFVGKKELEKGKIKLKNMLDGEERLITLEKAINILKKNRNISGS